MDWLAFAERVGLPLAMLTYALWGVMTRRWVPRWYVDELLARLGRYEARDNALLESNVRTTTALNRAVSMAEEMKAVP
jgi:hypothetical protein